MRLPGRLSNNRLPEGDGVEALRGGGARTAHRIGATGKRFADLFAASLRRAN